VKFAEVGRGLIKEGLVRKQSPKNFKLQDRYLHLFTDFITYSKDKSNSKGQAFEFKGMIPLELCLVSMADQSVKGANNKTFQIVQVTVPK
jgi:hypothetical protein